MRVDGERIKQLRLGRGFSQKDLSDDGESRPEGGLEHGKRHGWASPEQCAEGGGSPGGFGGGSGCRYAPAY